MIEKSVVLRCSPEEAFHLFTGQISAWWPQTHRLTKDPLSELMMEQSGRFWERSTDGREAELGRVLVWDPPHRLELDFYMGTNAMQPTKVNVTFSPVDEGTRVTIQHRPKPESAELWNARAPQFEKSWTAVLAALADR